MRSIPEARRHLGLNQERMRLPEPIRKHLERLAGIPGHWPTAVMMGCNPDFSPVKMAQNQREIF
jgi:hypothetical protein